MLRRTTPRPCPLTEYDGALVDTENGLLFNVGGTALRPLMAHAVTFQRRYRVPAATARSQTDRRTGAALSPIQRCKRYPGLPSIGSRQSRWALSLMFRWALFDKPAPVWNAIREYATPLIETASAATRFLINVQITDTQSPGASSVASIVKHRCRRHRQSAITAMRDPTESPKLSDLKQQELARQRYCKRHLLDERWAALGARRLVKPFGRNRGSSGTLPMSSASTPHITLLTREAVTDEHPARWRLTAELMEAAR